MGFNCGIVGLPNVGKSTLFNALTKNDVLAANYPFATIEPNVGVVGVPDARLPKLAEVFGSAKIIPATVDFVDIAGIVKGASEGEGLGNKFLATIREADAICQVTRAFADPDVVHVDGKVDPSSDIETINTELILADLQTLEKAVPRLEKEVKGKKTDASILAAAVAAQAILERGTTLFAGGGDIGLTAVACHRVQFDCRCRLKIRVEHRRTQRHRAAAVLVAMTIGVTVMVIRRIGVGCVASIKPSDAQTAVALRPHRNETMLGFGGVVMHAARRAPVHAVIARTHQHHVVGVGCVGGFLQPMGPQRAVGGGHDMRRVGPVGEHRIADRDRAWAFPMAVRIELGELQRRSTPAAGIDPADQHAAVRNGCKIRLRRAGHRRQRPGFDYQIAGQRRLGRGGFLAAARKHGEGDESERVKRGAHVIRVCHQRFENIESGISNQ